MKWEGADPFRTPLLPEIARGEGGGCLPRKGGGSLRSARGISIVCVINESVLPKLSFNVSAPSKNISFCALPLGLRFMRPNLQAMCAWIKGTWDCLFMSDPRRFPVSCLSAVPAKSMMGRWSPLRPPHPPKSGIRSFHFHSTFRKLSPPVCICWPIHFCKFSLKIHIRLDSQFYSKHQIFGV